VTPGIIEKKCTNELMSASVKVLRVALNYTDPYPSYLKLHKFVTRATPNMASKYKLYLLLLKTFDEKLPDKELLTSSRPIPADKLILVSIKITNSQQE
jgi:hypothetical protein